MVHEDLSPCAVGQEYLTDTKILSGEQFTFYSECHGKSWRSFKQRVIETDLYH